MTNLQLFEKILRESNTSIKPLKEFVAVESGRIYISQTDGEKQKSIDEIWKIYEKYAKNQASNNSGWHNIKVENTNPPLLVDIFPTKIEELFFHTAKREEFRPKIICLQALPLLIKKMSHIVLKREEKGRKENEYWYIGTTKNVAIDNILYDITVKIVKKVNVKTPQFYIYFVNDILLKRVS